MTWACVANAHLGLLLVGTRPDEDSSYVVVSFPRSRRLKELVRPSQEL